MKIWLKFNDDKKCVIHERDDELFETLNLDEGNCPWEVTNHVATLTLGSQPRQGLAKLQAKSEAKDTFHAPGNVGKCERINPHIPKCTPILGIGVSMDF
jgi:hypothetical protein